MNFLKNRNKKNKANRFFYGMENETRTLNLLLFFLSRKVKKPKTKQKMAHKIEPSLTVTKQTW
jgi:hypothetical protein